MGAAGSPEPSGVAAPALQQTFQLQKLTTEGSPRCVPGRGEQDPQRGCGTRRASSEGDSAAGGPGLGDSAARPRALGRQRGPRSAWGRVEVGIGRKVLSRNHAGPSVGGPLTPLGPRLLIQNFLSAAGVNRSFQPERGASMQQRGRRQAGTGHSTEETLGKRLGADFKCNSGIDLLRVDFWHRKNT